MSEELPAADAWLLQSQHVDAKGSGEWEQHRFTSSRAVAEKFLNSSPEDVASRAVPLEAFAAEAVVVAGVVYNHPTRDQWKAAGR